VPQIAPLAEQILQLPVSLGQTNSVSGLKSALDQPEFVTAIGLVKFGSFKTRKRAGKRSVFGVITDTVTDFWRRP
jgi:cell division ATPase FtsA